MNNNMAGWYTKGVPNKGKCYIGYAEDDGIVLNGIGSYIMIKNAGLTLEKSGEQIIGFLINSIPILIYHSAEEVTAKVYGDTKNMALEMFSRDPRRLIATAKRIGLPTDQLELMLEHPERFEKRKDISIKA